MKKFITGMLVLSLLFSMAACEEKNGFVEKTTELKTAFLSQEAEVLNQTDETKTDDTLEIKDTFISDQMMEEEEIGLYAEYAINNGEIVLVQGMDNDGIVYEEDKLIWEKIKLIVPEKYMAMITKFEVVTDGLDGILASVNLNEDNKTWTISVDLDDTLDENYEFTGESIVTLIHEMSHIIALNYTQMVEEVDDKTLYTVMEGTLKKDSYLSLFYDKFWKHHMAEYSVNSEEENIDNENDYHFYSEYKEEFINEYAATNPVEDFAESFAYFVVRPKPTDSSIKSQKLLFFYEFPEFIKIRDSIRKTIDINKVNEKAR